MGISSDGIIAYGIDLGEGLDDDECNEFPWQDREKYDGEFREWVLREILGFTEEWYDGNEGYFDRQNAVLKPFPLEMVSHCSYDYPMYFLSIKGTERRASRGYPTFIEGLPEVTSKQRSALKEFAEEYNFKYDEEKVGWHLFSMYG